MQVQIMKNKDLLFSQCRVATSFFTRFMGLMGKKEIKNEEAIIFPNCNSIHTCFMKISIDAIFISKNGEVIKVFHSLKPWKLLMPIRGARHVIETSSGQCQEKEIKVGDQLSCDGVFG